MVMVMEPTGCMVESQSDMIGEGGGSVARPVLALRDE